MLIMYRHCGATSGNSDHRDSLINESQESIDRDVRISRDRMGLIGRSNYHRIGDTLAD